MWIKKLKTHSIILSKGEDNKINIKPTRQSLNLFYATDPHQNKIS